MRKYRRIKDKRAAIDYILANRATKTLREMGEDLNISHERVRQLAVWLGAEKPRKTLDWYRAEVKRLKQLVANLQGKQHLHVAR